MMYIPGIVILLCVLVYAPTYAKVCGTSTIYRKRRRKSKGFFGSLLEGQRQTERRNGSHRGVMCGPGGSKKRK